MKPTAGFFIYEYNSLLSVAFVNLYVPKTQMWSAQRNITNLTLNS